ncbi:glycosyltransferase [Corynebacterium poyangense]|uniref:Glycosyltransferase n=1 Tax=Corynebacterium poyangense TaxID=2684405 RepID=A0A7H0SRP1_9CORY|nr:glycosyltransferase [Corynebacterium poyangense]QNQ91216.1 glycosyltransferase [Corynebacterium poyangense]
MSNQPVERLQRLLLPRHGEPHDVRMLYLHEAEHNTVRLRWEDRGTLTLPAGTEASFETYFNAFPASYWRRWSQLDSVILYLQTRGAGSIEVYRSKVNGTRVHVASAATQSGEVAIEISLTHFEDGGWLWFDAVAETELRISGGWYAPCQPQAQTMPDGSQVGPFRAGVTVGIPTFNRPRDAVNALQALASDPEVDQIIEAVILPDQGTQHPADEPGYHEVVEHFGERFHEFRQGNLGGSGGYSRIMFESLTNVGDSPYTLYMDDDIVIEPESILRSVQIARYARSPFILGGQMLNLQERAQLRTMGEIVDPRTFMWSPAPYVHYDHDFAEHPLSDCQDPGPCPRGYSKEQWAAKTSRDLHRRIDVDFNGWWMCLFPRVVCDAIGLPLPLFIKWDDTEYSLRGKQAGFPTVTWPGVAIWHMAWADKDDAIDWQAYFHLRNRLIVAAMYHDGPVQGIIANLRKSTFKHLMCMEYSTLAIQLESMRDFLAGPEHLFDILESSLPRINAIRKEYSDAQVLPSAAQLPAASGAPGVPLQDIGGRLAKVKKLRWLYKGLKHSFTEAKAEHHDCPQVNLTPDQARWFSLSRLDSATVTTAGNNGVVFRKRDRELAKKLLKETWQLQKEIAERFDEMRERYRAARPELSSRESWEKVFNE